MTRSTTVFEGLLLKEVSPSLYYVVDTPLVILFLPFGGWQVYCDHPSGKRVPYGEPRALLELAAGDAFCALETARSAAMKLPILPHPALEAIRDVVVIRPSAQDAVQSLVKPMERPTTPLPAPMDEERMIDLVAEKERSVPQWDADKGREWLGAALRKRLLEGRLSATLNAIKAADAGDEICDTTLRSVYAEIPDKVLLDERETAYLHIRA
jgi:hypothetical protein